MNANHETDSLLTDEDLAKISASLSEGEAPEMDRTLLETWREVLANAESDRAERISPEAAMRALNQWPKMTMEDVVPYLDMYYDYLLALRQHLYDVIDEHPEALKHIEDDAEANHDLYLEVLFRWQVSIAEWEKTWDIHEDFAYARIAAQVDVSGTYLGVNGLSSHLQIIKMEFTPEQQQAFTERLQKAVGEL